MSLASGQFLVHYRLIEKIGEGGMGVVWKAHDTKLDREVALKFLPSAVAEDSGRLARFKREARLLAALNHPHIAAIHGFEDDGGARFLVMELVGGETLAERLERGPLPVDDALGLAHQVSQAMETAHGQGIVHRDLKPANIKIAPDGNVKVLDFGLAKAFDETPSGLDSAQSPTMTAGTSLAGAILGTPAYMSPEQAHGRAVDRRADVWGFGCVLYEMLTGLRAFTGESATAVLASVLKETPDWDALPRDTTAMVKRLVRRCLEKDPARRLRDFGDIAIEIDEISQGKDEVSSPTSSTSPRKPAWRVGFIGWAALVVMIATVLWTQRGGSATRSESEPVRRFTIELPAANPLALAAGQGVVTVSPDDTRIVYVAQRGGTTQLYMRELDGFESRPIPGTEGGAGPFFSPDSQWVGFVAAGALRKVFLGGGRPETISDAIGGRGAAWLSDGTIVFPPSPAFELARVSSSGGKPEMITTMREGDFSHRWPSALPGERAILYTAGRDMGAREFDAAVLTLADGRSRTVLRDANSAVYVASGHLVFERGRSLLAAPFDLDSLEVTGDPIPVVDGVHLRSFGPANFAVSRSGTLVYVPPGEVPLARAVVWADRAGGVRNVSKLGAYEWVRISPDGRRILGWTSEPIFQLEVQDAEKEGFSTLTFREEWPFAPVWTPDGKRVVYGELTGRGQVDLYWRAADGTGDSELLFREKGTGNFSSSISPDGKSLVFTKLRLDDPTGEIWGLELEGDRSASPIIVTEANEFGGTLSPDGHWLAYTSDESGQAEVYVRPYPERGGKRLISEGGGVFPIWAPDGTELFYRRGPQVLVVRVATSPGFSTTAPKLLFEGDYTYSPYVQVGPNYDVSSDGRRFLMVRNEQGRVPTRIRVVLNWFDELERIVPTR